MYKVKLRTWKTCKLGGRRRERKKLVYRRWSSFLHKSVVIMSGWRGQRRCVFLRLEEVSGDHQPEDVWGFWGCDQEEKRAAVLLTGHQR